MKKSRQENLSDQELFEAAFDEAIKVIPREEELRELAEQEERLQTDLAKQKDAPAIIVIKKSLAINAKRQKRLHREIHDETGGRRRSKDRPCQIHRAKVRDIAGKVWGRNPSSTIEAIISSERVLYACEGHQYAKTTLRNWIKDLAPNRKPGRRAGSRAKKK